MRDPWERPDPLERALRGAVVAVVVVALAFAVAYGIALCGNELAIDRPGAETDP